jgi:S-DNA-T family DNA segregation ATPase FtsK/SpoIIIE
VEIDSVMVGPTVTRYALKPAQGVKLSKIASLNDNLALALAAKSIVIQAPIPGQALVGIEIPNRHTSMVGAGSLFTSDQFENSPFALPLAIGKNIAGDPEVIGLDKAPHILVAGQTGAGKSVTVHALIVSMLYKYGPNMLKFILVDPKQVEMTLYDGIPHLFTPVIIDAKKAILALR